MAKTKISEFSSTAASNTDIDNINIAEGCSPANVNNAIRSLMSQLKNQQDGTSGDNFTVGGNLTVTGTTTLTTVLPVASGGTGASTNAGTAYALKGANSDITSITGLTTPLTIAQGGTGTASTTFANLATNVTGTLPVANGGTGAATLTSGSVIVGAGTSTPTFVAPTTTGNVLFTTDGTTWSSTAKIVRATAVASTSGTSIDFTSIPSGVKRITLMFNGVSTTGSSNINVQLGTGGTPETSGYVGTSARYANGNTTSIGAVDATGFSMETGSTDIDYGTWVFTNITSNTWVCSATVSRNTTNMVVVTGSKSLSGVLNMLRITTASGTPTFDAGSINIMYE